MIRPVSVSNYISISNDFPVNYIPPQIKDVGNDSNLLIVFYVQIMPDDFVMQLHRF
ncbi:putative protein YneK [Escherichia albertii]|nr:putative protein YneK [Escherichia albertii]QST48923.1 putative protein YneK [Escherichia albertii]